MIILVGRYIKSFHSIQHKGNSNLRTCSENAPFTQYPFVKAQVTLFSSCPNHFLGFQNSINYRNVTSCTMHPRNVFSFVIPNSCSLVYKTINSSKSLHKKVVNKIRRINVFRMHYPDILFLKGYDSSTSKFLEVSVRSFDLIPKSCLWISSLKLKSSVPDWLFGRSDGSSCHLPLTTMSTRQKLFVKRNFGMSIVSFWWFKGICRYLG